MRAKLWLPIVGLVLAAIVGYLGDNAWRTVRTARTPGQMLAGIFVPSAPAVFGKNRLSLLLLGIDYNYDNNDQPFSKKARSDTIMALSLDFASSSVRVLSVPRDMDVVLPNGTEEKINDAYAEGGVREAESVVAKFLGIPGFDRYVVLRVNAARDLIDAIGGVDVDVENANALRHQGKNGPIDYDDNWGHLHVHLKPGLQHLSGEQAVGYSRFRHDWCSDPCRIMRQQQVTRAIVERFEHHQLELVPRLQSMLAVLRKDVDTNLNAPEELSLAMQFGGGGTTVATTQVPYVGDKDLPLAGNVLIPDERAKAELVAKTFAPAPAPSASAAGLAPAAAVAGVHVTVENGAGERGLAGKVAQALTSRGFVVDRVADADSFGYARTEIEVRADRAGVGEAVRRELGLPTAGLRLVDAALTTGPSDVTVIVGRDYATVR